MRLTEKDKHYLRCALTSMTSKAAMAKAMSVAGIVLAAETEELGQDREKHMSTKTKTSERELLEKQTGNIGIDKSLVWPCIIEAKPELRTHGSDIRTFLDVREHWSRDEVLALMDALALAPAPSETFPAAAILERAGRDAFGTTA